MRFPKLRVTCKRKILHRVNAQGTPGSTSAHLTDTNPLTNLIHEKTVQTRRRTSGGGPRGASVPRSQSWAAAVRLPSLVRIARQPAAPRAAHLIPDPREAEGPLHASRSTPALALTPPPPPNNGGRGPTPKTPGFVHAIRNAKPARVTAPGEPIPPKHRFTHTTHAIAVRIAPGTASLSPRARPHPGPAQPAVPPAAPRCASFPPGPAATPRAPGPAEQRRRQQLRRLRRLGGPARAHLGSVPGGGGGSSEGLPRRGPGDGGKDHSGGRPGACGALGRWGPAQRRRRGLNSRRGRRRRRRRGRVGGGASRRVQVRPRRRRDAPSSSRPQAGRRLRRGPRSEAAAADLGALRSAGSALSASGSGGPAAAAAAGARRARGRPCQGRWGRPGRRSGLRGGGAGGGGCGSRGRRAEVRSCHRGHLVALTDKNPPPPASARRGARAPFPAPPWPPTGSRPGPWHVTPPYLHTGGPTGQSAL